MSNLLVSVFWLADGIISRTIAYQAILVKSTQARVAFGFTFAACRRF